MKRLVYILVLSLIFACDGENVNDCFQKTGTIIQQEFVVESFSTILVNPHIELVIKEGDMQKVIVETGTNLMNDVEVVVSDGELVLTDNNNCNFVRDYGVTKIYVTSPNITSIRSATQYDIRSDGVLTYPSLIIYSENSLSKGDLTSGNFDLEIDNASFGLVFNNLSNCFISGKTTNLNVFLAAGNARFEGGNLIAQDVFFTNRSSNDIIINPQQSLTGEILGTGDVISLNTPPEIAVEELYTGRLIFK